MDTYKKDHETLQAEVQKAKQEASDARVWLQFLSDHREIHPSEANRLLVLEYFSGEPLSIQGLDEAFANPTLTARIAFQSEGEERKRLLAELTNVFHGPEANLKDELARTKYLTNAQIESKIALLRSKHEMEKLAVPELKAVVRSGNPIPEREELPAEYTRKAILQLPPKDLRKLIDRFGSPQINARLLAR
jgi:hypothetical protein